MSFVGQHIYYNDYIGSMVRGWDEKKKKMTMKMVRDYTEKGNSICNLLFDRFFVRNDSFIAISFLTSKDTHTHTKLMPFNLITFTSSAVTSFVWNKSLTQRYLTKATDRIWHTFCLYFHGKRAIISRPFQNLPWTCVFSLSFSLFVV